jgi:hypothetical protein
MQNLGPYTAETICAASQTSTLPPPQDKGCIAELAAELFGTVKSRESDKQTLERISEMLPDLLRAFALKLGHKAQTPMHRDVSFFVHKYRRWADQSRPLIFPDDTDHVHHSRRIQVSFEDMFPHGDVPSSSADRIPLGQLAISQYLEERDSNVYQKMTVLDENDDLNSAPPSLEPNENDDTLGDDTGPMPDAGSYRDFIVKTPAYSWLVASLQREAILTRATPDLMEDIRGKILCALPSSHKVSRKAPSQEYKATFELDWDPLSFVKEQKYTESPDEALERAITITGSANDAQAVTPAEYLSQTWPATGKYVMRVVIDVIRNTADHHAGCKYIVRLFADCDTL